MLARKAFETYHLGYSIDQTVRKYIEDNKLENSTTYGEDVDAVKTIRKNYLEWARE